MDIKFKLNRGGKSSLSSWPYLLIGAIIFIFNIISIWGFDGLMIDDQGYYFILYDKSISDLTFNRNIFHSLFTLGILKIAAYTSVFFARFLIVILLSIPCGLFIYYFSHYHYKLEKYTAITIAVLPFILPNEILVPTYLAGSYMLLAILFALISIFFILKFSGRPVFSVNNFILAILFYYLATESSELIAVMLPVFLFLIFIFRKLSAKQFILGSALTLIAIRKAFLIIENPHGAINSVSNNLSFSEITRRIIHFMDYINPLHGLPYIGILNIIIISIILTGAIMVIINHKRLENILYTNHTAGEPRNKYFYISYYYLLPLAWLVISTLPFLFYSHLFNSRYFIVTAIALSFLLLVSISVIYGSLKKPKIPLVIILILLISISGINRQRNFNIYYNPLKYQFNKLKQTLKQYDLPQNAQVIITTPDKFNLKVGKGIITKSTGALQYMLKRRDVNGQIMTEKCFYDPFQIYNKAYVHPEMDIDTTRNTYLLRCFNKDSSQDNRLHYALRWVNDKEKDSPWSIFHFDENGKATNFTSGIGYVNYESTVDSLSAMGITRNDILFGGMPDHKDSLRLGL